MVEENSTKEEYGRRNNDEVCLLRRERTKDVRVTTGVKQCQRHLKIENWIGQIIEENNQKCAIEEELEGDCHENERKSQSMRKQNIAEKVEGNRTKEEYVKRNNEEVCNNSWRTTMFGIFNNRELDTIDY